MNNVDMEVLIIMLKILKKFNKKDIIVILCCIAIIIFQVWIELRLPEYMSTITRLIQTTDSNMSDILKQGGHMLLCAFGSMVSAIIIGYLSSGLSARFSLKLREKNDNILNSLSTASTINGIELSDNYQIENSESETIYE